MNHLVTGGTGTIGRVVVNHLLAKGATVRVFCRSEYEQHQMAHVYHSPRIRYLIGDVRDKERVIRAAEGVDAIFHCAALKHVYACERNPFEAVSTNVNGTQNVIDAALHHNIRRMVHISTDKAVQPTTTMGATKLLAERLVLDTEHYKGAHRTTFAVVRMGNILSSRGSVLETWKRQMDMNEPITITDPNATRYVILPNEAGAAIMDIAALDTEGVFVPNMKALRVIDLAEAFCGERLRFTTIGLQTGEKLHEWLDEERCSGDVEPLTIGEIKLMLEGCYVE